MSNERQAKRPAQPLQAEQTQMQDAEHDAIMAQVFRQDPAYAVTLLNNLLAQGHWDELVITLNQLAKAFGQESELGDPDQAQLDCALPESGKPEISTLSVRFKAMGQRLTALYGSTQ